MQEPVRKSDSNGQLERRVFGAFKFPAHGHSGVEQSEIHLPKALRRCQFAVGNAT